MTEAVQRVEVTEAAQVLLRELVQEHGPLLLHQSGGCCDGSAPMCFPRGEFRIGQRDVLLGAIAGCPFYMGADQFEYWKHTQLTIDVVKGRGSGFSLEAPRGVRLLVRSRVFTQEELDASSERRCSTGQKRTSRPDVRSARGRIHGAGADGRAANLLAPRKAFSGTASVSFGRQAGPPPRPLWGLPASARRGAGPVARLTRNRLVPTGPASRRPGACAVLAPLGV